MQSIFQRFLSLLVLVFLAGDLFAQTGVTSAAGDGTAAFAGDGGPAPAASLDGPTDVAVDSAGNLYIADRNNNRVRKVAGASGVITTAGGNGNSGSWYLEGGPSVSSVLNHPFSTAVDAAKNFYIADFGGFSTVSFTNLYISDLQNTGDSRIHKVDGVAGTINQIHVPIALSGVLGIAVDGAGNLYISERHAQRIFKFVPQTAALTQIAGTGTAGFSGDGGPGTAAQINNPAHLAIDSTGNVYFSDTSNNRIRKIAAGTGIITTVAGSGPAGPGGFGGDGGPATSALLNDPEGIAVDSAGNLFIADTLNKRIRRVSGSTGLITSLISAQPDGSCGNVTASLESPQSVVVNASGDTLFIADDSGNRIWKAEVNPKPAPPTLTSIVPASGATGTTVTVTLTGSGFAAGAASAACQNGGAAVSVSGTGVTVGNVTVTSDTSLTANLVIASDATLGARSVTVATDGGTSASLQFTVIIPVGPPPTITSVAPPSGNRGSSVTLTLTGTNFDTRPGNTSVAADGTGISLSQVAVTNATSLTAVANIAADAVLGNHGLRVVTPAGSSSAAVFAVLPQGPAFIYNLPQVLNPTEQAPIQVALASASPDAVTGTLTLTFAPNASNGIDDPAVTFINGDTSTRSSAVTFPANTETARLSLANGVLQAGTVAGTMQLAMTNVQVGGIDAAPTSSTFNVEVPLLPPVITSVRILNSSSSGFDVEVTGYSTPREIATAIFDFGAASGAKLLTVELKPDVASSFTSYYQSPASDPAGSAFVYTQPFIIKQGSASAVASVTVTLTNSQGASQPVKAQ